MKNHDGAYQQMLAKRREWYASNKDKIKEKQRQRYHDKHDTDIKNKRGRKPKLSITGQDYGNSTSPDTSDQEH